MLAAPASAQTAALSNPASLTEKAPATYKVKFDTSKGVFVIQVNRDWAPNGADRFYNLVKNGYYDNVRFFRVISGFMVQFGINGDPKLNPGWRNAKIPDDPRDAEQQARQHHVRDLGAELAHHAGLHQLQGQRRPRRAGLRAVRFRWSSGMNVVDQLHAGYGEGAPSGRGPDQMRTQAEGNAYLQKEFPQLDFVKKATIEP